MSTTRAMTLSEVDELILRRTKFRELAIETQNRISILLKNIDMNSDHLETELFELNHRIDRATAFRNTLRAIQAQLFEYDETEADEERIGEDLDFRITYTCTEGRRQLELIMAVMSTADSSRALHHPGLVQPSQPPEPVPSTSAMSNSTFMPNMVPTTSHTIPPVLLPTRSHMSYRNLPKLDVQKFSGDPLDWMGFWESFCDVDSHPDLTDSTKLNYLKLALTETVKADIQPFGARYNLVKNYLLKKYGRKDILFKLNLQSLHAYQQVDDASDFKAMCDLNNFLRSRFQAFEDLGIAIENYYPVVTELLPREIFLIYKNIHPNDTTIQHLLEYINNMIENWELAHSSPTNHINVEQQNRPSPTKTKPPTAAVFQNFSGSSRMNQTSSPNPTSCTLCQSTVHTSWGCDSNLSLTERRDILRAQGRCLTCHRTGHIASQCRTRFSNCRKCDEHHLVGMCPRRWAENRITNSTIVQICPSRSQSPQYLLKTIELTATSQTNWIKIIGLIDDGSQRSFVSRRVAEILQPIVVNKERITTCTFDGVERTKNYDQVTLTISNDHACIEITPLVMDRHTNYYQPTTAKHIQRLQEQLKSENISITTDCTASGPMAIDLIIGMDLYHQITTGKQKRIGQHITAVETIFGWALQGALSPILTDPPSDTTCLIISVPESVDDELNQNVKRMWQFDTIGVETSSPSMSTDVQLKKQFEDSLSFTGERYSVGLPWLDNQKQSLQNNYEIALKRLKNLLRKLSKNPDELRAYHDAMMVYVREQHAEIVPPEELNDKTTGYFLPHRPVYSTNHSTKLRIVFDASSHADQQISLNDCIHPGSNRSMDLVELLIKFRQGRYAGTSDFKKAFLQIQITPDDRRYIQFLWIKLPEEPETIIVYRMTRVIFGLSASPYLLRSVLQNHATIHRTLFPAAFRAIMKETYVDDLLFSRNTKLEIQEILQQVESSSSMAGFELHKQMTNVSHDLNTQVSVLGHQWDPIADTLTIPIKDSIYNSTEPITKRKLIQRAASLYDPLGLLAPITIQLKMLFQEVWKQEHDWDTILPEYFQREWTRWRQLLSTMPVFTIPRFLNGLIDPGYTTEVKSSHVIHLFADASPAAYGAVAYLISQNQETISTHIILARFRVAPIKTVSLPRLELMAALLAARMFTYLHATLEYHVSDYHLWTDSTIVLSWITHFKPGQATFISNRIIEITKRTSTKQWHHCPGDQNPADAATRYYTKSQPPNLQSWRNGPDWIVDHTLWPPQIVQQTESIVTTIPITIPNPPVPNPEELVPLETSNDYHEILRRTASVYRIFKIWHHEPTNRIESITHAERLWIRTVQHEIYNTDMTAILQNPNQSTSELAKLRPYLDSEHIIRITSRLNEGDFPVSHREPILLPPNHRFTQLLILQTHIDNCHTGIATVLQILRQRYWIPRGRQIVKKIINQCVICRRWLRRPVSQPVANLPDFRSSWSPSFTHVGVDFAGPLLISNENDDTIKYYIALFTCASTRAVHLELTSSLSTTDFLLALRRFIARRGTPTYLYSDNATTFRRAHRVLNQTTNIDPHPSLERFLDRHRIQWKFIAEAAPWWGGFWERMVRSIKEPLRKCLRRQRATLTELSTILTEIEAVVNSRPLSIEYDDPQDPFPITPALLLSGRPLQLIDVDPLSSVKSTLSEIKRWRLQRATSLQYRWRDQYLLFLRSAHLVSPLPATQLRPGQIVLLSQPSVKRLLWPLARIIDIFPGRDGTIRSCRLRTVTGKHLTRPVQSLIILDESFPTRGPGNVE